MMSAANSPVAPSINGSGPAAMANGLANHAHDASSTAHHSHAGHGLDTRPAPPPPTTAAPRKSKQKKPVDSNEASKLVAQKIAQLELDQAGEKDQEAEIEREVKKANRELHSQTSKMDNLQKIDHLTKRCADLFHDMKKHERENIKNKKRGDQLQKERDQSRTELSKTISLKEKLEKLCRELQKENNKLKNENKVLKDHGLRAQNSWDERYSLLLQKLDDYQDAKDNPQKQIVDVEIDELFRERFKSMIDQYELRELYFNSLMRTKEIEVQVHMARHEREKKRAEAEYSRCRQLSEQVQTFSKTETELRNQLNVYVDKFKQEMEDMSKKTRQLEKENGNLKRKHEAMNKNIFKMAEERAKSEKDMEEARKREEKLKSIITQMQQQGRGIPQGVQGVSEAAENCYTDDGAEVEGEESEYEDEDEDADFSSGIAEYGEDDADLTEEEQDTGPQPFGPAPPPPPTINGH